MTDEWTIRAYTFENGEYELGQWASGFGYQQADQYYKSLYDSKQYAKLEMKKTDKLSC